MTLRVEQGKRAAGPLRDDAFAATARTVARMVEGARARPQAWLFPGRNPINPMTASVQINRAVHAAAQDLAGHLAKRVSPHTLRHQLRHPPARTERRHPGDPGPALEMATYRCSTNSRPKPASATGSIRALAKWCQIRRRLRNRRRRVGRRAPTRRLAVRQLASMDDGTGGISFLRSRDDPGNFPLHILRAMRAEVDASS